MGLGEVSQGAKRGGNAGVKGVQSEGEEWEWESGNSHNSRNEETANTHIHCSQ